MTKSSVRLIATSGQVGEQKGGTIHFTNRGDVVLVLGDTFMAIGEVLSHDLVEIMKFVFRTRRALMLRGYRVRVFNTLPARS